jgi:hypothetical protein
MEAGAPEPEVRLFRPCDLSDSFPCCFCHETNRDLWILAPIPGLLGYWPPFYARPFCPVSRPSPLPASPSTQVVLHAVRAMSLNGLDNPAVVDAYQSALADAGGW